MAPSKLRETPEKMYALPETPETPETPKKVSDR